MLPFNSNPNYNMIMNTVAVGNHQSSYDPFDVVVNLNYPQNGSQHRQIHTSHIKTGPDSVKTIIRVGIYDDPSEDMQSLLSVIIPQLINLYKQNPNMRVLFHCYAGVSRSSTIAIAYLMSIYGMSLDNAYNLVKQQRPIIQPNYGFAEALKNMQIK